MIIPSERHILAITPTAPPSSSGDLDSSAGKASTSGASTNSCCMALGDVDNDGDIELVVADINGLLLVYKYLDTAHSSVPSMPKPSKITGGQAADAARQRPALACTGLGSVTALAIGPVKFLDPASPSPASAVNAVIAINAEGTCHIFFISPANYVVPVGAATGDDPLPIRIFPVFALPVPVNVSRIFLRGVSSVAPEQSAKLVLGRTDRYIHVYDLSFSISGINGEEEASLILLRRHQCEAQVGSMISLATAADSVICISQPHGDFMTFDVEDFTVNQVKIDRDAPSLTMESSSSLEAPGEIIGGLYLNGNYDAEWLAICTLDGYFKFHEVLKPGLNTQSIFKTQVHHQFFAISKIGNPRKTYVVAFAWDGLACIVDCDTLESFKFPFADRICAGLAGEFSVRPGVLESCLFFTDFHNQIHVYPGIDETVLQQNNSAILDRIIADLYAHKDVFEFDLNDQTNIDLLQTIKSRFK